MTDTFLIDRLLVRVYEDDASYRHESICLKTFRILISKRFNDYAECLLSARRQAIQRKVRASNHFAILIDENDQIIDMSLIAKDTFKNISEGLKISEIEGEWFLCPTGSEFRIFTAFESVGEGL